MVNNRFEEYSCSKLLHDLDEHYEHSTDSVNYANYLLRMKKESSIKGLFNIYDNTLWKIIVVYSGFGDETLVLNTWYAEHIPADVLKQWFSLNTFLNENIVRLFDSKEYSDKFALECYVNLRKSQNCQTIRDYIFSKSSEEVRSIIRGEILPALSVVDEAYDKISPYDNETNGALRYRSVYIENIKQLIDRGYVLSKQNKSFEAENSIIYLASGHYSEVTAIIILASIVILLIGLAMYYLFNFGIIGIILLIGAPGALLAFARKGR